MNNWGKGFMAIFIASIALIVIIDQHAGKGHLQSSLLKIIRTDKPKHMMTNTSLAALQSTVDDIKSHFERLLTIISVPMASLQTVNTMRHHDLDVHPVFGQSMPNTRRRKTILFWTDFFGREGFGTGVGSQPFLKHRCEFDVCEVTHDRKKYNQSDAVIFQMYADKNRLLPLPTFRPSNQSWVMFNQETPENSPTFGLNLSYFNDKFNLTMTYRMDSDIPFPYANIRPYWPWEQRPTTIKNYAKTKTKLVCHFTSHCITHSQREKYVAELQKYVQVDVYGKCGLLKCDMQDKKCDRNIPQQYKFRLAFENSICRDYATEKLFHNAMMKDIVPIFRGGYDTHKFLPPKSYIDVRDFSSPKELADYLKYLDKNDEEYNKYFAWKRLYTIVPQYNIYSMATCAMCKYLQSDIQHKHFHIYHRIDKWWGKEENCLSSYELDHRINLTKIF